jgi:hypothetical protein
VGRARVVHPGHAEENHPLGLDHPVQDARLHEFGMPIQDGPDRLDDLLHGLVELGLRRVPVDDTLHEFRYGLFHDLRLSSEIVSA